jgi:hypothetical protein
VVVREPRFVTAINCIDGRVQEPVARWMARRLAADYVDMITEPGPDAILARGRGAEMKSIKRRVLLSTTAHGSRTIAVVGHHECTGNPVPDETHIEQIQRSVRFLRSWRLPVRILGLWVNHRGNVELICDAESGPTER